MVVRARHHILAIHLSGPPAKCRHAVLDRSHRNTVFQPVPKQRFHVFWFQGMTVHASIANPVQLVRHQREVALSLHLGAEAALPVVPAKLFQLVVQVSQCVFSCLVSVSDYPVVVTVRVHLRETILGHNSRMT